MNLRDNKNQERQDAKTQPNPATKTPIQQSRIETIKLQRKQQKKNKHTKLRNHKTTIHIMCLSRRRNKQGTGMILIHAEIVTKSRAINYLHPFFVHQSQCSR